VHLIPESVEHPFPHTWCDAQGRFELHQLRLGSSRVLAEAPGFTLGWPYPLVQPGDDVVLKVTRNAWLEVEVIGGHLHEEWIVRTSYFGSQLERAPRNERVVRLPVHPGEVPYTVELPDRPPISGSIQIFPGTTGHVRVSGD
jgi:hypothetical protein